MNSNGSEFESDIPGIDETGENIDIVSVSKEEIVDAWVNYIDTIDPEESRMLNALRNQEPEIDIEQPRITVFFRNKVLVAEFKENFKAKSINFISGKLNCSIEVSEKVLDIDELPQTKYYTDMDKLKFLIEKNPSVAKLKQDFNLDFE